MRAAVVTEPYKVEIQEIERPSVGPKDVLIKVKCAGICGSDLHLFMGSHAFRKPPAILGHELAGEVVEVGSEVTKFVVGDRVTVLPQIGCGECEFCQRGLVNICLNKTVPGTPKWNGTFVEYFVAPENVTYKLAEGVSYEAGAMAEPLAVAVHVVSRLGSLENKESVAILGSGTIGLLCLIAAKHYGFKKIICTDVLPYNLEMAKKLGADLTVNSQEEDVVEKVRAFTNGRGVDATFVAAGAPVIIDQASAITCRHGDVVLVAMITKQIPVNTYSFVFNEQRLLGAQTYQTEDFETAIKMINEGLDLNQLITKILPMEETQKGLEILHQRTENVVKILVKP